MHSITVIPNCFLLCMQGMPLLIYLGAVMAILYYYGITQWAACKLGWLMQITLGTTAIETLNTAANIFLDGVRKSLIYLFIFTHVNLLRSGCTSSSLKFIDS